MSGLARALFPNPRGSYSIKIGRSNQSHSFGERRGLNAAYEVVDQFQERATPVRPEMDHFPAENIQNCFRAFKACSGTTDHEK